MNPCISYLQDFKNFYDSLRKDVLCHILIEFGITMREVKVKVKCTLVQTLRLCTGRTTHRVVEVQLCSFLTTAIEGGEGSGSGTVCSLHPGKNQYPLNRRLGGPQSRSGQVRNISPPPGFDSRIVQPIVAIRSALPGTKMRVARRIKCVQGRGRVGKHLSDMFLLKMVFNYFLE